MYIISLIHEFEVTNSHEYNSTIRPGLRAMLGQASPKSTPAWPVVLPKQCQAPARTSLIVSDGHSHRMPVKHVWSHGTAHVRAFAFSPHGPD
jgi:hypothetical protein